MNAVVFLEFIIASVEKLGHPTGHTCLDFRKADFKTFRERIGINIW
jgi:hypothetical protein